MTIFVANYFPRVYDKRSWILVGSRRANWCNVSKLSTGRSKKVFADSSYLYSAYYNLFIDFT